MGTCLSKKKGSSSPPPPTSKTPPLATKPSEPDQKNKIPEENVAVTVSKPKVEGKTEPQVKLKNKENKNNNNNSTLHVQEKREPAQEDEDKGHDDAPKIEASESSMCDEKVASNIGVASVRTSSCTKEEVDAILLHCGRLSRSSSGKAATSSSSSAGRRYSGSKRSYDFDHCENHDTISNDEEQKKASANGNNRSLCEDDDGLANGEKSSRQHRQRHRRSPRPSPEGRRRRTPSREREQQQQNCSGSSRERRVSRSPGRRTSETTPSSNASNNNNNNNNTSSRPGKMVSVPASVTSSLVMDKSNNFGGSGGGESATAAGVKRITVKRNVGAASPRSQSPARANGNASNARVLSSENQHHHHQQQPSSLSRNNSRKADQSPYRRNPLSDVDPNSLANNGSCRMQNKPKKEIETEANQKQNGISRAASNSKRKVQQEEDVKVESSMTDNVVVKTVVSPVVDNLKPNQTITRSRSSRRSRDLDLNPETPLVPPLSYTSLLLEDIHNFHQKNTPPSVSLPACVTKACSILEAVADLNSNTAEDKLSPPTYQSSRNECNVPLSTTNNFGKRVSNNNKDPFVESEVVVNDDVMEPSLHKYVTVSRGGSLCGVVDMEDQESSGSNSFTFSGGQHQWGISSASWEPNSADSRDCLTSRLKGSSTSSEAISDGDGASKKSNIKSRECDHQHSSGIGRSRAGAIRDLHTIPVVTAAAST